MENNEELDLELDQIEANADRTLKTKNRFQELANDKREALQAKEAAEAKVKELEAKALLAEKTGEFFRNFNQVSTKYPEASNFQDKIKEKVDQGYDLEDATVSVLNKEGKFSPAPVRTPNAEGGSAITNMSDGDKSIGDMSANEKLAALQELEKSGELTQALRAGINRS